MCGSNPMTNSKIFNDRHFFDDLGKIIELYNNADPQSPSNPGSGDNPSDLFQQQLFQDDGGKPLFNFGKLNGSGDQDNTFSSSLALIPVMGLLPNTNTTTSNAPTPPPSTDAATPSAIDGRGDASAIDDLYLERYGCMADIPSELE